MNGVLQIDVRGFQIDSSNNPDVPIMVEIYDVSMRRLSQDWLPANSFPKDYPVAEGKYGVRVGLASGAVVDRIVSVSGQGVTPCIVLLDQISPHETQQWAYFTQPMDSLGSRSLNNTKFAGLWLRLWHHVEGGDGMSSASQLPIPRRATGTKMGSAIASKPHIEGCMWCRSADQRFLGKWSSCRLRTP